MRAVETRLARLEAAEVRPALCQWLHYGQEAGPSMIDGRRVLYFGWLPPQDGPIDDAAQV